MKNIDIYIVMAIMLVVAILVSLGLMIVYYDHDLHCEKIPKYVPVSQIPVGCLSYFGLGNK